MPGKRTWGDIFNLMPIFFTSNNTANKKIQTYDSLFGNMLA